MSLEHKKFDVSVPTLGLSGVELAATVRFPEGDLEPDCTVLVCWPGGSYGQPYWDFPAESYSFSRHLSERGHVVVNVDPLGVSESTRPEDADLVGLAAMAEAAASLTEQVRSMVADGSLASGLAPLPGARFVGVGHSMGGALVTAQQALFSSYDAIAILGFAVRFRDTSEDGDTLSMPVTELVRSPAAAHVKGGSGDTWDDKYILLDRAVVRSSFHLPDVPSTIMDADDALSVVWPRRPIVEAAAGHDAQYAPKVAVPVFFAFGTYDLAAEPRAEVQNYSASNDITLVVLENSAHCHNFSTDRHLLWGRMHAWL